MFAAVVPPGEALEHLEEFLAPRREAADFRWTAVEQVHLTLAFYPEVSAYDLDELVERLRVAAARRTPLRIRMARGGAFPHAGAARVLWSGLEVVEGAAEELDRLATGARSAAARAGVVVDGQRFRPHLTVARLGRPQQVSRWVHLLDTYVGPSWTLDHVVLVESHLGEGPRHRPRYEVVARLPVGAADSTPPSTAM